MFGFFKIFKNKLKVKLLFKENKSKIGKIISLNNPQYITVGKNVKIKDFCRIDCYDNFGGRYYNPNFVIEDGVNISYYFTCLIADECSIGENSIFAHNVTILTENHGKNIESEIPLHAQQLSTGHCIIGKNCWIGCNVIFLPNSSIGDNCIVAANAVVRGAFPDNCMIGGTPAHILKVYNFKLHKWVKYND